MRSRRIDLILLSLGIMLIFISSYQLFFKQQGMDSGISLGTISSTTSVVKTKNALQLGWKDAFLGIDVSENQLLYTDADSSAEVRFLSGDGLKVGENSLIRITSKKNVTGVNVDRGVITARINSGNPLAFELNGEEYLLSGNKADVQINLQQGKGEIGVLGGSLTIEKAGVKEELTSESALIIDGTKTQKVKINYSLSKPLRDAIIYTVAAQSDLSFEWNPATQGDLSLTELDRGETTVIPAQSGIQQSLAPGHYQWKVSSDSGSSITSNFKIVREQALDVIRPVQGEKVEVLENEQGANLLLQWHGDNQQSYQIEYQIADSQISSQIIKGTSLLAPLSKAGSFRWRVRINDPARPLALWNEWQNVDVSLIPKLELPADLAPHDIEFQIFQKSGEEIELSWKASGQVERELKSPDGKSELKKISAHNEVIQVNTAGLYQWRLRSVDHYDRQSAWSEWKSFTVTDLSGEVSKEGLQRIQLSKPDQEVSFSWKAKEGTTSVFELSRDKEFKDVIRRIEVKDDKAKMIVAKTGSYFWRSRQYLPDGTINVGEPKRVIIEPTAAPGKPKKLPDLELPIEYEAVNPQSSFKWWHLFISPAYADEMQGVVKIPLPQNSEAKKYILRIYRQGEATTPIMEKEIATNHFDWIGAEPGEYLWQYSVIDFWDRQSPFSDLSSLTIVAKGPSRPLLIKPIRAEEVSPAELEFSWSESNSAKEYHLEVAAENNFSKVLFSQKLKGLLKKVELPESQPGLYFWRVRASDKAGNETPSSTGRFTLLAKPVEERSSDQPQESWQKTFKNRLSLAWSPSMDEYTFKDSGKSGEISGTAMMGIEIKGNLFFKKWILSAELLRQMGKVFEKEDYLLQKIQIDPTWKFSYQQHLLAIGPAVAQISGQEYSIENNVVKGSALSSLSLGVVFRGFHPLNKLWEIQSKAAYLTGDISEMELSGDLLRQFNTFYALGGFGYINRNYDQSKGKQSSLKFSLGLGKEF